MLFKRKTADLTAVDYTDLSKSQLYFAFSLVSSLVGHSYSMTVQRGLFWAQFFLWGLSYGLLDVLNKHFLTICKLVMDFFPSMRRIKLTLFG